MPCYYPLKGYRSKKINENGKRPIVFKPQEGFLDQPVDLPCGKCIGCRLEYSRQWAIRCMHESDLHGGRNSFITLTYAPQHIPEHKSLKKQHLQDFWKRVRKKYVAKNPYESGTEDWKEWQFKNGIRYFQCGEYGSDTFRPHYHILMFNHEWKDKYYWANRNGQNVYRSPELEKLWPYGHSEIGTITFKSAAYVARYMMKKAKGEDKESAYLVVDTNGEIIAEREHEFGTMSLKPAIGENWFKKYGVERYKHDSIVINGQEQRPPKYYDRLYERINPKHMADIKINRRKAALAKSAKDDRNETSRLQAAEAIKKAQISFLKREI